MFSENNKLSVNGIWKLIVTEETGLVLLFAMYFAGQMDILTGVCVITAIFALSCGYLKLVLHMLTNQKHDSDFSGKLQKYIKFKSVVKAFLLTGFGVLMLIKYVDEQLLPGTHTIFIAAAIFVCAFFIARKNIEIRGRLSEFLYLFVLIPVLAVMLYELFRIDYGNFFTLFTDALFPAYPLTLTNLIRLLLTAFFSFLILSPWGYLLTDAPFFHEAIPAGRCLYQSAAFLYIVCLIQFLLSELTYNVNPVLSVVISLMMYISAQLHYGMPKKRTLSYFYTAGAFVFLSVMLILPSALNATHLYTYLSRTDFHKIYTTKDRIIDARELENRSFVLSMIISADQGEPVFTCELADYSGGAGELSSDYVTLTNLKSYPLSGGKQLDFSHIKAILFDTPVENSLEDSLSALSEEYRIPGKTLIFQKKDFPRTYDRLISGLDSISLGEVLDTLADNQNIRKELMLRNFILN